MTKYTVKTTSQFKKDYKLAMKQRRDLSLLRTVVALLADGKPLPQQYHDHPLSGRWQGHRECHISPDWLLIYRLEKGILVLTLSRVGSHGELFGM